MQLTEGFSSDQNGPQRRGQEGPWTAQGPGSCEGAPPATAGSVQLSPTHHPGAVPLQPPGLPSPLPCCSTRARLVLTGSGPAPPTQTSKQKQSPTQSSSECGDHTPVPRSHDVVGGPLSSAHRVLPSAGRPEGTRATSGHPRAQQTLGERRTEHSGLLHEPLKSPTLR